MNNREQTIEIKINKLSGTSGSKGLTFVTRVIKGEEKDWCKKIRNNS